MLIKRRKQRGKTKGLKRKVHRRAKVISTLPNSQTLAKNVEIVDNVTLKQRDEAVPQKLNKIDFKFKTKSRMCLVKWLFKISSYTEGCSTTNNSFQPRECRKEGVNKAF